MAEVRQGRDLKACLPRAPHGSHQRPARLEAAGKDKQTRPALPPQPPPPRPAPPEGRPLSSPRPLALRGPAPSPPSSPGSPPARPGLSERRSAMGTAAEEARAVLECLFHPQLPFGQEEEEPPPPPPPPLQEDGAFAPERLAEATELELQGVAAAEAGDTAEALARFGQAIQLLPTRASAYNNRAQALRLRGDVAGAMEDLAAALELSEGAGRVGRQAFVQRGLLLRLQGQEEAARQDFEQAARLGSPFARQQLVRMNPYAALCNQMLAAAMKKLRGGAGGEGSCEGGAAAQAPHLL